MLIYKSELYGDLPAPGDFCELINHINLYYFDELQVYMWRGQSNIEWRIDHSAYRRLKLQNNTVTEKDIISYEDSLLKQATHKGYRYQNGRKLNDIELLALLQHHGAATRLLDFSRNALVALWFSANEDVEKTGILLGLNTQNLGGYENGYIVIDDYKKHIESIKNYNHPQTWEPPFVTARVAAQHSQFLYSGLSTRSTGSLAFDNQIDKNLLIAISPNLKSEVLKILAGTFDIHFQTLFPDIDGFGKSNNHLIHENKMWRW